MDYFVAMLFIFPLKLYWYRASIARIYTWCAFCAPHAFQNRLRNFFQAQFSLKVFCDPMFTMFRQYNVRSGDPDAYKEMICNYGKSWDDDKIQLEWFRRVKVCRSCWEIRQNRFSNDLAIMLLVANMLWVHRRRHLIL